MKKGKVVDMFSRRDMEKTTQDTKKNDQLANELGKYLGVLPAQTGEALRKESTHLQSRAQQIDELAYKWGQDYYNYSVKLTATLDDLGILPKDFDPSVHNILIDKDGHVFLVGMETIKH